MAPGVLFSGKCALTALEGKRQAPGFFYNIKTITGRKYDTGKKRRYGKNSLYR